MQKLVLAAIGAACLFSGPVFAQTSSQNSTSSQNNNSKTAMSAENIQQAQQKIKTDLQNDGYKDVNVIANSFLVHAKDKRGEPVVMIINPDSVFAVTQLPERQSNNGNPSGTNNHNASTGLGNSTNSTTRQ